MNSHDMHVTFRAIAQQMGMQNVRAILDEQIDICLNAAQIEKIREYLIINSNANISNNRQAVFSKNVTIPSLNTIRTLYSKDVIETKELFKDFVPTEYNPFEVEINNDSAMFYTSFGITYDDDKLYNCRIIENEDLDNCLRDYCNKPTFDSPLSTVFGDEKSITVRIYNGSKIRHFTGEKVYNRPTKVIYTFIKYPPKIKYDYIHKENNVDCILPEYLHNEIVERAAQKYLTSVGLTSKPINNSN